jgi:mono/diheme cytochrome c family protein
MNDRLVSIGPALRVAFVASALIALPASAQAPAPAPAPAAATEPQEKRDPPPPLPAAALKDQKLVSAGEALWKENCAHCHGSKAYPGKAPKLQPHKYKPEFVWDRVHNGFKDMPAWKELYSPEQVISLVAWVMSEDFWP